MREHYLYIKFKDDSVIDLTEAKIHAKHCIELCNGEKIPFMIDARGISVRMEEDARRFFMEFEPMLNAIKGTAIIVNITQTKFLARYYIKHHQTNHPIKIFDDSLEALSWLKTLN